MGTQISILLDFLYALSNIHARIPFIEARYLGIRSLRTKVAVIIFDVIFNTKSFKTLDN